MINIKIEFLLIGPNSFTLNNNIEIITIIEYEIVTGSPISCKCYC